MKRDIAFVLLCLALFAVALTQVGRVRRAHAEQEAERIARLEGEVAALRERFSALAELVADGGPQDSVAGAPVAKASAAPAASGPAPSDAAHRLVHAADPRLVEAIRGIAATNDPEQRRTAARVLLSVPADEFRLQGARTLLELDVPEGVAAVSQLVAATKDRSGSARTALRALDLLDDVSGGEADAALRGYAGDASALVRVQAARLLDRRGDSAPIARVSEELTRGLASPDHRLRLESLALLGVAGQPGTVERILPLLRDPNSEIRNRAARTLGMFRDPALVPALAPLLSDPVAQVRAAAAQALQASR